MAQQRMKIDEYRALQNKGVGKKRGEMNRTEAAFAREELEFQKLSGAITNYQYEAIKFRLANGAWYTGDFAAFPALSNADQRITIYEVKGFLREAAHVRIKVAAELFPMFKFIMCFKQKKANGGGWRFVEY